MLHVLPLLLVIAIAGASLSARQQDEGTISKRLVRLLFPGMAESIIEGLHPDVPSELLPDAAVPVVSMKFARGVTVIAEAPSFTAAGQPRYERKLAAAGWKLADGPSGGGLMASSVAVPKMFCKGEQVLSYTIQPETGGGALLRMQLHNGGGYGPCRGDGPSRGSTSMFEDIDLPPLPPPTGRAPTAAAAAVAATSCRRRRDSTQPSLPETSKRTTHRF